MTLWTGIETFQTLIIGAVGFAGVILTLWLNAKVTRQQRRDERHHDRETLRVALLEELKINRESLKQNMDSIKQEPASPTASAFVPTDPMDDAYRAFTHRIGLLPQAEVGKVMNAYLSLRTYNAKLFLVGDLVHTSPRHVQVPAKNFPLLAGMQENLIGPLDEAIKVMERARDAG